MLPDNWQNVRRLLVIQLGDIEDLMQTEPALQMLRHSLPNTEITLLTIPACKQVAGSWVDDVFVYERITSLNTEREMDLIEKLRDRSFDADIAVRRQIKTYNS